MHIDTFVPCMHKYINVYVHMSCIHMRVCECVRMGVWGCSRLCMSERVCMFVWECVGVHEWVSSQLLVHGCTCMSLHALVSEHEYACTGTRACRCVHMHKYACTGACTQKCAHKSACMSMHKRVCMHEREWTTVLGWVCIESVRACMWLREYESMWVWEPLTEGACTWWWRAWRRRGEDQEGDVDAGSRAPPPTLLSSFGEGAQPACCPGGRPHNTWKTEPQHQHFL